MTVVHAAKFYAPVQGGMETIVRDLCDGTADEWDVRVVAFNQAPRTVVDRVGRVEVVRAAAFGQAASVPLSPAYFPRIWGARADCVVLHEPNPIAGTALFLHMPAPRLVVWHHSDLLRPWWAPHTYGRIQRALYRRAECVVVSSPNLAAASTLVGCARRVAVIPFGIDSDRYRRLDQARETLAGRLRAGMLGPRVLFVGRFVYYKGVEVLVDAMAGCEGTLVLVGAGPLEAALRARASALGIADRVRFAGHVSDDDLPAYYRACDLFVLPSVARTEAFGVVQVEAMAAGLPVVSTNLPTGVPWVNQDGVSGLVVEPGDAAALGAAIRRVTGDAALRTRLSDGARRRADGMFTRERMVRSFHDLVEAVVRAPGELDERLARVEAK